MDARNINVFSMTTYQHIVRCRHLIFEVHRVKSFSLICRHPPRVCPLVNPCGMDERLVSATLKSSKFARVGLKFVQ